MQNEAPDAFAVRLGGGTGGGTGLANGKMDERHIGGRAKGRRVNFINAEYKKRGWQKTGEGAVPYLTDRGPKTEPGGGALMEIGRLRNEAWTIKLTNRVNRWLNGIKEPQINQLEWTSAWWLSALADEVFRRRCGDATTLPSPLTGGQESRFSFDSRKTLAFLLRRGRLTRRGGRMFCSEDIKEKRAAVKWSISVLKHFTLPARGNLR